MRAGGRSAPSPTARATRPAPRPPPEPRRTAMRRGRSSSVPAGQPRLVAPDRLDLVLHAQLQLLERRFLVALVLAEEQALLQHGQTVLVLLVLRGESAQIEVVLAHVHARPPGGKSARRRAREAAPRTTRGVLCGRDRVGPVLRPGNYRSRAPRCPSGPYSVRSIRIAGSPVSA